MPHVFLVVSPDPATSRALRGVVEAMGYEAVLTATMEGARGALASGGACGIVVDAAIDDESKRHRKELQASHRRVDRRLPAVEELRACDPRRNRAQAYVMPILVVCDPETSVEDAGSYYEAGAGAVVRKPVPAKRELLSEKIDLLLKRAGRADHQACGVTGVRGAANAVHLALTGERQRRRTEFRINDRIGHLQNSYYATLLRLALGHARRRAGWMSRAQLGIVDSPEVPSRLRTALRPFLPEGYKAIEADWGGSLRLAPEMMVTIDLDALEDHPVLLIRQLVENEREEQVKKGRKRG